MTDQISRRGFLKGAIAVAVAAALPTFIQDEPVLNAAYPRGNVLRYGATCDGTTDDTVAIQASINDVGAVYLPPGTYLCSSTIQLKPGQRIIGISNQNVLRDAKTILTQHPDSYL